MSWEQSYLEHPLWPAVSGALAALDAGCQSSPDHDRGEANRLRWILTYLGELGVTAEPLVSQNSLDACHANVVALGQVLEQWQRDQVPALLSDAATSRVNAVLEAIRGWPVSKDRYAKGVIAAAEEFVTSANSEAATLRTLVADMTDQVAALRAQLDGDRAASEQLAGTTQQQVDRQTVRLDDALNGHQATFAAAEAERANAHTTAMAAQAKEAAEQRSDIDRELEADRRGWATEAQTALAHLAEKKKEVDDLVNAVAVTGTATEYRSYAKQEGDAADFWRWVAAGAFGLAFVVFLVMLLVVGGSVTGETPWQLVVFKVTGSVGLLALGAYAARESTSHRKSERAAKSIDLDLAALEPFIVNMPENNKREIRLGAARRLFVSDFRATADLDPVEAPDEDDTPAGRNRG